MKSVAVSTTKAGGSGDVRMKMARDLVGEKRFAEAMEIYDAILKGNPDAAVAYVAKASIYFELGNYDEAENYLKGALHLNSKLPRTRILLARIAEKRGDLERCLEENEEALRIQPTTNIARLGMARAYMRLERPEDAERVLREALRFSPQFTQATLMLARVLRRREKGAEAVASLDAAIKQNPDAWQVHLQKALLLLEGEDYRGAIAAAQESLKCEPKSAKAAAALGRAFCATDQYNQGIAELKKAVALDPSFFPAKMQLVQAYEQSGRFAEATKFLRGLSRRGGPNQALVHIRLGDMFVAQELFAQAVSAYEAALLRAEGLVEKHPGLAQIATQGEDPRKTALAYHEALEQVRLGDRRDVDDDENADELGV